MVIRARSPRKISDFTLAACEYNGKNYVINRPPTEAEYKDIVFGWLLESGVTSNSVLYVKDGVTVGIGTGEQDRVGVAEIARDKAYRKLADRYCFEAHRVSYADLKEKDLKAEIDARVAAGKRGADRRHHGQRRIFPLPGRRGCGTGRRHFRRGPPRGLLERLPVHRGLQRSRRDHGAHGPAILQTLMASLKYPSTALRDFSLAQHTIVCLRK